MNILGAHVVVTGGASGIGAALAAEAIQRAAAHVVIVDRDEERCDAAARRIGPNCSWIAADLARHEAVTDVVQTATQRMGTVDIFCANAGIGTGASEQAPDEVWDEIWRINTLSHVWAAQALLPAWLERGSGHFLVTASAAGLLTNLGDAPYSVTKAGAVAFASWLSATYQHRGIGVSCLCPQGVNTPLLFPPGQDNLMATEVVKAQRILEADDVARFTWDAVESEEFLILPHEEVATYLQHRAKDPSRWLSAMNSLQQRLEQH